MWRPQGAPGSSPPQVCQMCASLSRGGGGDVLSHVGRRRRFGRASEQSLLVSGGASGDPLSPPPVPTTCRAGRKLGFPSPTAHPEAETELVVCPCLTALQSLLQPLPQPRCRNERSRISSSSSNSRRRRHNNSPHCGTGTSPETRRMRVPLVKVQPSVNLLPRGKERRKKKYDGPTVKDHPAFWALPPWLTESLAIPSQLFTGALQDQGDQ